MKGNWMKPQLWIIAAAITVLLGLLLSQNGTGGVASRQEERMAEVLGAIAGAGRVEVALYYAQETTGSSGEPTGALVVAQGADDMQVRLNLIRAVRTLLGLPENAVDVFVMEEGIR